MTAIPCSIWPRITASLALVSLLGCASPAPYYKPTAAPVRRASAAPQRPAKKIVLPSILPRVMIMIDEQSLGTIATAEVESMALRKLLALNVPVVDQDLVRANMARSQHMLQAAGDNRGAAALGAQFGADIVIVGEAVAKPSARRIGDTNLRSYQAVATLRAVRTDTATTLAAVSEDATQVGLEDISGSAKVLRAAGEAALDKLLPDLLAHWTPGASAGRGAYAHRVDITVGGVDQIWKLKALRESLRARDRDLQNVVQRAYTSGMAEFSVESRLPAEELAEELVLAPPEGLRIQVLDIGAGRIQIRAVEK